MKVGVIIRREGYTTAIPHSRMPDVEVTLDKGEMDLASLRFAGYREAMQFATELMLSLGAGKDELGEVTGYGRG